MKQINTKKIALSTLGAIKKASKLYIKMSLECSPRNAPEYWFTSCIAKQLFKLKVAPYIDLEYLAKKTLRKSGSGRINRHIDGAKRFDVVLSWKDKPNVVIEVKTGGAAPNTTEDIKRLCAVLRKVNSLQFCVLAYFDHTRKPEKGRIKKRLEKVENNARNLVNEKNFEVNDVHTYVNNADRAWGCLTLSITRKRHEN